MMFIVILSTFLVLVPLNSIVIEAKPSTVAMPEGCEGKTYCFKKSADYPQKLFIDLWAGWNISVAPPEKQIENRISEQNEFDVVCEQYKYNIDPIYEIVDEDGFVRHVAQIENKFLQTLRIVECVNPGRVTKRSELFSDMDLLQFNVSCVETRLDFKFMVLSKDQKSLELATAKGGIPVHCSCRYSEMKQELPDITIPIEYVQQLLQTI